MAQIRVELLSQEDVLSLHECSLELLETVGARFESAKARAVLVKAGAKVDEDTERVLLPRDLVEWTISTLQRPLLLAGRVPEKDILLDGSRTFFTSAGICPYVVDRESGKYRESEIADLAQVGRIMDFLDPVGLVWFALSPTADAPGTTTDLASLACLLANTSKHIQGQLVRPEDVEPALEMVGAAAGSDPKDRPLFSSLYCPVSPLQHEAQPTEAGMLMAENGVPIDIFALPLSGGTSPMSLAGTVIQNNCETLSAAVLFKLVNERSPLIFSCNSGIMDMRSASGATATPETFLMSVAQVELAGSYQVPTLGVGFSSDAAELGFRCGAEDAGYAIMSRLARPDIMIGLGTVEYGQAISLPKLVLDAELCGGTDRLTAGIETEDAHSQVELIREVGPGGNYLDREETLTLMRAGEHWSPDVLRRTSYAELKKGGPDELALAQRKVDEILESHEPSPLPTRAAETIDAVMRDVRRRMR